MTNLPQQIPTNPKPLGPERSIALILHQIKHRSKRRIMNKAEDQVSTKMGAIKDLIDQTFTKEKIQGAREGIYKNIDDLGQHLEEKMISMHNTFRQEMEKHYKQREAALKKQALWQWIAVIGAVITVLLK